MFVCVCASRRLVSDYVRREGLGPRPWLLFRRGRRPVKRTLYIVHTNIYVYIIIIILYVSNPTTHVHRVYRVSRTYGRFIIPFHTPAAAAAPAVCVNGTKNMYNTRNRRLYVMYLRNALIRPSKMYTFCRAYCT